YSQCLFFEITFMTITPAERLFRATLSIFGAGLQLSGALRSINCLRALGPSFSATVAPDGLNRTTVCMI
ncbi:MAG: hypothetical protein JSV01_03300, partial [Desulfobacterales bacterium]